MNYVPLSRGTNFCGLIGLNGIGKSSVLEGLDCFFNHKEWVRNIDSKTKDESYIAPIFIFDETEVDNFSEKEYIIHYSKVFKNFIEAEIPKSLNSVRREIWLQIQENHKDIDLNNKCIIAPALYEDNVESFGLFGDLLDKLEPIVREDGENDESYKKKEAERNEKHNKIQLKITEWLLSKYTYIYIPKDIEPERFVKFETEEIQHLLGESLVDIIKKELKESEIFEISKNLKKYIEDLSNTLPNYQFKVNSTNQPNLKAKEIYNLIANDFFAKRELFKNAEGKDIPLSNLSSGEKQQAIMVLIHSCVTKYRGNNKDLIIGVDEPESALHISICYDQFHKLFEISQSCNQVIFSSHWYGFIPSIEYGNVVNIVKQEGKHASYIYDIDLYREQIKNAIKQHHNTIPIDVSLKGVNDLIQSIITSVICDNHYNWLVCEGSSDKIYLSEYLKEEIRDKRLRIIPVCGANEVKRIYQNLALAFDDLRNELKGKVFLLVDTDAQFVDFESKPTKYLSLKRIVNDDSTKTTKLVDNQSNPKAPKTDIEDVLNGKAFKVALDSFKDESEYAELLLFSGDVGTSEKPSFYAMDLKPSEYDKLEKFFSSNNNGNKVLFAQRYVQEISKNIYTVPSWIEEIKNFFDGD